MLKWVHKLYVIKNLGQCQSLMYYKSPKNQLFSQNFILVILCRVTIIVSLYINSGTPRDLEHFGNPKNEKILKETLCFDKFLEDYFRKVRLCWRTMPIM